MVLVTKIKRFISNSGKEISIKEFTQPPAPNSGGSEIKVPRIGDLGASELIIYIPETA